MAWVFIVIFFFFFNDTATTEIYTLSLHDALPISARACSAISSTLRFFSTRLAATSSCFTRSEEHTSELQSPCNLVCRLLLEKKKKKSRSLVFPFHSFHLSATSSSTTDYTFQSLT